MEPTEPASSATTPVPTPARAELTYGREPETRRRRWFKRWLKRFAIGVTVLILVVLTAHAIWLYVETNRLTAAWAALRAAGEPTTLAEISAPPVPDDQNGFDAMIDVGKALRVTTPARERRDTLYEIGLPLTSFELGRLSERQAEMERLWPQLDAALAKPNLVMKTQLTSPVFAMDFPELLLERDVANFLADSALVAHAAGDDGLAVRRLAQCDRLSAAPASLPTLIGGLVKIGIQALSADRLAQMAPTLRIGDQPGDASPAVVRQAIDRLLDSRQLDADLRFAFRGERVATADMIDAFATSNNGLKTGVVPQSLIAAQRYLLRPLIRSNETRAIDITTTAIESISAPDFQAAQARVAHSANANTGLSKYTNLFADLLVPSFDRSGEAVFRIKAERTAAAIALACRWFEVDHGRLPTTLNELVPNYLPGMPGDVFAAGNAPFHANLTGADPIFWSVGKNGTDDGGSSSVTSAYPRWSSLDAVFHLRPQPRQFSPDMQRMITLDPDARVRVSTATTQPVRPTAEQAVGVVLPDWDQVDSINAEGDPAALGLDRRRDVLSWLADAALIEPTEPDAKPATRPTTQPVGYVWGTALVAGVPWQFTIGSDGVGVLTAADGKQVFLWKTAYPYPSEAGRRLWR